MIDSQSLKESQYTLNNGCLEIHVFIITNPAKKKVALHFYSRAKDADKLDFAMYFLKKAMV